MEPHIVFSESPRLKLGQRTGSAELGAWRLHVCGCCSRSFFEDEVAGENAPVCELCIQSQDSGRKAKPEKATQPLGELQQNASPCGLPQVLAGVADAKTQFVAPQLAASGEDLLPCRSVLQFNDTWLSEDLGVVVNSVEMNNAGHLRASATSCGLCFVALSPVTAACFCTACASVFCKLCLQRYLEAWGCRPDEKVVCPCVGCGEPLPVAFICNLDTNDATLHPTDVAVASGGHRDSEDSLIQRDGEEEDDVPAGADSESSWALHVRVSDSETVEVFQCLICVEDHPRRGGIELECGHLFCWTCFPRYLESKISEAQVAEHELVCPHPECKAAITTHEIQSITFGSPLWDKFLEFRLELWRPESLDGVFIQCAVPSCEARFLVARGMEFVECPTCHGEFCTACRKDSHNGITCDEYQAQMCADANMRSSLDDFLALRGMRRCPVCGIPSERMSGCNFMTCESSVCRRNGPTHWCYLCGGELTGSQHYSHFQDGPFNERCQGQQASHRPRSVGVVARDLARDERDVVREIAQIEAVADIARIDAEVRREQRRERERENRRRREAYTNQLHRREQRRAQRRERERVLGAAHVVLDARVAEAVPQIAPEPEPELPPQPLLEARQRGDEGEQDIDCRAHGWLCRRGPLCPGRRHLFHEVVHEVAVDGYGAPDPIPTPPIVAGPGVPPLDFRRLPQRGDDVCQHIHCRAHGRPCRRGPHCPHLLQEVVHEVPASAPAIPPLDFYLLRQNGDDGQPYIECRAHGWLCGRGPQCPGRRKR